MAETAKPMQLKQETLKAFTTYAQEAETAMESTFDGSNPFLWSDDDRNRARRIRRGDVLAQFWSGHRPLKVPDGLIHDWVGAVYIPGTTVAQTLAVVQNYNRHKQIYAPDVMDSKLISHHGNDFKIFLRLLKKKIITVVLDTDHDVCYLPIDDASWFCRSHTTRIAEVDDPGTPREKVQPPDTGYGFLWRLYSYWRFAERANHVIVECRALSLTRDVPLGLGWILESIVKNLPRESLIHTLRATRTALVG
jgi:hypothetical protein